MPFKQVLVLRTDLDMGRGKYVAQGAHASLLAYLKASASSRESWESQGSPKIAVKIESESALLALAAAARAAKLPHALVRDAGRTQLEPGTLTALGIGPAPAAAVDRLTGKLKLL